MNPVFRFCSLLLMFCCASSASFAQTGVASPLMHKADSLINAFLKTWNIDGGTAAITKDGRLVYNRAFGFADQDSGELTQPYHLMRIASNSKPITGIAVMKLVQDGQLGLNDTVFGAGRILRNSYYLNAISDNRIYNITVKQLLEHTAGWNRNIPCDGQSSCDPIGFPLHVTSVLGEGNPVADSALIKFLLTKGLNTTPGVAYAYSNIGYLVLAKVIEQKTGMAYDAYVKSVIMDPLSLCDMHLGKNLLSDKREREAEYNNQFTTLSSYGTSQIVPWQYGGWNLEAMHAHGGWISTSADYVRMLLAVDGFTTIPDILSPATIAMMTTGSTANAGYGKGWSVNSAGNWWHTGSLDGTTTFMARTANGYTWAFHFNARQNSTAFYNALDALPWNCLAATTSFPAYNLFAPSQQASSLTATKSAADAVTLNWNAGNGDARLVLATENTGWGAFPVDGTAYTGNSSYGAGANLGTNTFVVYRGTAGNTIVTGLDPAKTYRFTVLELADNVTTGNNAVYKYGCRPEAVVDMAATGIGEPGLGAGIRVRPNPVNTQLSLENQYSSLTGTEARLTDIHGRILLRFRIDAGTTEVDVRSLPAGMYLLQLADGSCHKVMKL